MLFLIDQLINLILREVRLNMFGTSIEKVRIKKLNLDFECQMDLITGKGIRLQSVESFHRKADKFTKKNEKVYDGLQSEFFG